MRKKVLNKIAVITMLFMSTLTYGTWAQCYYSIGYMPSWQGDVAAIDYSKWTHINYAFAIPNTNGTVNAIENSAKLVDLVNRAHASNTKVLLAIGGWMSSSPSATPFDAIATNGSVTNFVNTCANLITQYNLDGIDIDWEYPTSQSNWNAVIGPLSSRIHGMGKLLTAAVAGGAYFGNGFGDLSGLDFVNIMAYDCTCPTNSPYSAAVDGINYWAGRGVPQSKRILGLPFYSSDNYTSLHVQKTNFAKTNAAGIMVWEMSSPGDINSIVSTLGTLCKGSTPSGVATVYKDCNFTGSAASLPVGDYTLFQLNARGILNDDISSVKVNSGYKVTLYWDDNFGGASKVLTADMACDGTWNDKTSSLKISTNTGSSFSTTIQAENWISMSGVQTEACSEGTLNVGWIDAGDWMAYNITIPTAGTYRVIYRVASPNASKTLRLEKDAGATQLGSVTIPNTGNWQGWTNVAHNVTLPAGTYAIGLATATGGFNINYLTITNNLSARSVDEEVITTDDSEMLVLSPNPVEDQLFITGIEKAKSIRVYNLQGQEVISVKNPGSSISVQSLTQGLHIALVEKQNTRIVKQKFLKK
jgi:chitinase